MKCQRGIFEVEKVQLGGKYNAADIDDCSPHKWTPKEGRELVVKAVLSDEVVRRPYRAAEEMLGRACKVRVIAGLPDGEG